MVAISGSRSPVTDGVPIRPLATNGRGSFGTVFLLSVIPASSSVVERPCR
jgi:hypothetical protein